VLIFQLKSYTEFKIYEVDKSGSTLSEAGQGHWEVIPSSSSLVLEPPPLNFRSLWDIVLNHWFNNNLFLMPLVCLRRCKR
jgi:hypothetical protein